LGAFTVRSWTQGFRPGGFNAQIAVDERSQVIFSQHATNAAPDVQETIPVVERIARVLHNKPKKVLADAGYWSPQNVSALERMGIDPYGRRGARTLHSSRSCAVDGVWLA
jgi:hypothetical protein